MGVILSATVVFLALTALISVFVYFFTDINISKTVLWIFLALTISLGLIVVLYIEYGRAKSSKRKNRNQEQWVKSNQEFQYRVPSAPPQQAVNSFWALNPRKWSTATALPAYSLSSPNNKTVI